MTRLAPALQRAALWLQPHREELLESWIRAVTDVRGIAQADAAARCSTGLETLLAQLATGDLEGYLRQAMVQAEHESRRGTSLLGVAVEIRVLNRCLGTVLARVCPDPQALTESLVAFDELGDRRLEILLAAQEGESARRLVETQEQAARVVEQARELRRANEALRRAEAESRHRAEQLGLLSSVSHRIAPIREPEELMQQAADQIRTRMNHTYVAAVVLEEDGALVGRWAGRPGLGRTSSGRAQGPPGGIIGRAIRQRAPQVVGDVLRDPDYHADVQGTRSELAVPLLEGARVLGALDFQSEHPFAFGLEDVAAAETLAEFLVIALHNARLFQEARRRGGSGGAA
ncbi:MAG TPA: GAF domain-containing protein [Vicinamibacteria bacterium]|nr:GAF domain-containing protein [Vicinamibacteria bacterium]